MANERTTERTPAEEVHYHAGRAAVHLESAASAACRGELKMALELARVADSDLQWALEAETVV